MALDIRTAVVIIALLYLTLPAFAWVVLARLEKQAVRLWCGGGLLTGAGFLLVGLRGSIPDALSHESANLLLISGSLSLIQALRLDLGIAWRRHRIWLAALIYFLAYFAIRHGVQDATLRLQMFYVLYAAWIGLLVHLALLARRIAAAESSGSARWIARVYFLVAGAIALRQLSVLSGISSNPVLASGVDMEIATIVAVVASVVGQISYVGLMLDRSSRRSVDAASARAREEVSRRLGAQLAQLDRQRLLGTASASLGHELAQPLSAILLSAGSAQRGVLAGSVDAVKLTKFLDIIVDGAQRARQIIERIRSFIRPSELKREVLDLGRMVDEVVALMADEAQSYHVVISCKLPTLPVQVVGDAIQFSQVVLNVVRNAIEAMGDATKRELDISLVRDAGRAVLRIRDTGPGLSPDALLQAGSPFFTTKASGLGLGLSISHTIMKQFNGTFSIKNAADGGALVELSWPALT
jgi:C4-dicarboxylate-specific signal transduction histidine kinase